MDHDLRGPPCVRPAVAHRRMDPVALCVHSLTGHHDHRQLREYCRAGHERIRLDIRDGFPAGRSSSLTPAWHSPPKRFGFTRLTQERNDPMGARAALGVRWYE